MGRSLSQAGLPIRICLVAASLALLTSSVRAQIDPGAIVEQERRNRLNNYRQSQNRVRALRPLDADRIEQVFQLRIRPDRTMYIDVPLTGAVRSSQYRLDVAELRGPTSIDVAKQRIGDGDQIETVSFRLQSEDMPDPDTHVRLDVRYSINYVNIQKIINDGRTLIQLTEQRGMGLPEGMNVRLMVIDRLGNELQPANVNIQAEDFPTLVRDYPSEVEHYVRPLLRDLGQEQLFAPDPDIAWQVLSDYWDTNNAAEANVARLLEGLDDPDYRRREATLDRLLKLGREGALVLRHLDRTGFSPEKHLMIDRALAPFAPIPERDRLRLLNDPAFMLDCLYSSDEAIRTVALQQLRKLMGRDDLKFDPKGSPAERSMAARDLREMLGRKKSAPATQPSATKRWCPECGNPVPAGHRFCPKDGTAIQP